jgi:hypothetical protein
VYDNTHTIPNSTCFRSKPALSTKNVNTLWDYSFLNPSSPLPNDLRRNPLNIKTMTRAIATMVLDRGMWNTNAATKEIAAPTKLYGFYCKR